MHTVRIIDKISDNIFQIFLKKSHQRLGRTTSAHNLVLKGCCINYLLVMRDQCEQQTVEDNLLWNKYYTS